LGRKTHRHGIRAGRTSGLLVAIALAGASPARSQVGPASGRESLRSELRALEVAIVERLTLTRDSVRALSGDKAVRSRAGEWRDFLVDAYKDALDHREPVGGLLDAWALSRQAETFLTEGKGRDFFGPHQELAIESVRVILDEIVALGEDYLAEDVFEEARQNVETYAAERPLRYRSSWIGRLLDVRRPLFTVVDLGESTLRTVAAVPLLPKRTAEGLQTGTRGIRDFNETAVRFTEVVEALPRRSREELETLLTSLDDRATTLGQISSDLRVFASEIGLAVRDAEGLTSGVQEALRTAGDSAATVDQTAHAVRLAAQELTTLVEALRSLAEELDRAGPGDKQEGVGAGGYSPREYTEAAQAIGAGAVEVRGLIEAIDDLIETSRRPSKSARSETRPFDPRDYAAAAEAIRAGSAEVRALLSDVRELTPDSDVAEGSGGLGTQWERAMETTANRLEQLMNHAAALAAGLILLTFVAAGVFVWVRSRINAAR